MARENEQTAPRILLVENNGTTKNVLREALEAELGCEVTTHANGTRALEEVLAGRFALVISSARLPGLDGIDLLRRMRVYDRTTHIPFLVVAVSPLSSLKRQFEAVNAERDGGAVEVIGKIALEPVLDAAKRLLSQRRQPLEAS